MLKIHFLDMGERIYGDCILIEDQGKTILIDGGHRGDHVRGRATMAIQDQLASLLNLPLPLKIDLLVVTHCHSDHIGCLPELLESGEIFPAAAVMADEKLGFGRAEAAAPEPLSDDPLTHAVVAALREEPRGSMRSDAQLAEFLEDAATVESRYVAMLAQLERTGVPMARCGPDDVESFVKQRHLGSVSVIAPSENQLVMCAEVVSRYTASAIRAVEGLRSRDAGLDGVALYRAVTGSLPMPDLLDSPGKGAALNDQSLLVTAGAGKNKCLLTGDMQFAGPEVSGLNVEMAALRSRVQHAGPFALVKLPHHGSYNGIDASVLDEWATSSVVITTGRGDSGHPSPSTLELLAGRADSVQWARTDQNGLVSATVSRGRVRFSVARGLLNDASLNRSVDGGNAPEPPMTPPAQATPSGAAPGGAMVPGTAEVVGTSVASGEPFVEVVTRVPYRQARVTITIDVGPLPAAGGTQPSAVPPPTVPDGALRLASGERLPQLLFVTNAEALRRNLGLEAFARIEECLASAGQPFEDLGTGSEPWKGIGQHIHSHRPEGVVLLGGHDVLPLVAEDVLPAALRTALGTEADRDPDNFYVWSDERYGDRDGDGLAELPVSRIPDASSAALMEQALRTFGSPAAFARFGIRNVARPFAEDVFSLIGGVEPLLVSHPHERGLLSSSQVHARAIYLMLHGEAEDGSCFTGEGGGGYPPALNADDILHAQGAVVFSGCCWGALTVEGLARDPAPPRIRTTNRSIALTFLRRGARAFVGCTGVHYSPPARKNLFGAPMHHYFWEFIGSGDSPARALFKAKKAYLAGMPYGPSDVGVQALELKMFRQFTCLGLGW